MKICVFIIVRNQLKIKIRIQKIHQLKIKIRIQKIPYRCLCRNQLISISCTNETKLTLTPALWQHHEWRDRWLNHELGLQWDFEQCHLFHYSLLVLSKPNLVSLSSQSFAIGVEFFCSRACQVTRMLAFFFFFENDLEC